MTEGMWGWENGEANESEGGGPCELQRDHCHIHYPYCQIGLLHVEDSLSLVCTDPIALREGHTAKSSICCFSFLFLNHIFWLSLFWIQYISPDMEIRSYSSTNSICKPLFQAWNQSFFNLALSPRLYVSMDAALIVLCEERVWKGGRWVGERMRVWT